MKNKIIIMIGILLLVAIVAMMSNAGAKSLYTLADLNQDPNPLEAYDIQFDGSLVYQATYGITDWGGGGVGIAIDSDSQTLT